jgi:hypothetical protein
VQKTGVVPYWLNVNLNKCVRPRFKIRQVVLTISIVTLVDAAVQITVFVFFLYYHGRCNLIAAIAANPVITVIGAVPGCITIGTNPRVQLNHLSLYRYITLMIINIY